MKNYLILIPVLIICFISDSCKEDEILTVPVLNPTEIQGIFTYNALAYGSVDYDGGAPVMSMGFCWNKTGTPTITDSLTSETVNTHIISQIIGLSPATTYHVRIYATNSVGTGYGTEDTFTTLGAAPSASTGATTDIAPSSATVNCKVQAHDLTTTVTFEFGTTTSYGNSIAGFPATVRTMNENNVSGYITGLEPGTTYHYRVKAVNVLGTVYGDDKVFKTTVTGLTGTVSDIEGNIYKTIGIGYQIWMAENLRTTKYNDNTNIPNVTDNVSWGNLVTPAYSWYDNDEVKFRTTYGALYNWYTISSSNNGNKNICPVGWHVPDQADWTKLSANGGDGGRLKETGFLHWLTPNSGATNSTGFTALGSGIRSDNTHQGSFQGLGSQSVFWSATEVTSASAWVFSLNTNTSTVSTGNSGKSNGYTIRCLKD